MTLKFGKKIILNIFLSCFLLVTFFCYGCGIFKKNNPGSTTSSSGVVTSGTPEVITTGTETQVTNQGSTEIETNPGNEDYVSYKNSYLGGNPGTLVMQINHETGDVKGYILTSFKEISLEGNSTDVCEFTFKANLSGTVDLKTFAIKGIMSGNLSAPNEACYNGNASFDFSADLNNEDNSVKGQFVTLLGLKYQFFLKKV